MLLPTNHWHDDHHHHHKCKDRIYIPMTCTYFWQNYLHFCHFENTQQSIWSHFTMLTIHLMANFLHDWRTLSLKVKTIEHTKRKIISYAPNNTFNLLVFILCVLHHAYLYPLYWNTLCAMNKNKTKKKYISWQNNTESVYFPYVYTVVYQFGI